MRRLPWTCGFILALAAATAQAGGCVAGGCSGQLCYEEGREMASTCEWTERYRCYQTVGKCERQKDGSCGWTQTEELAACFRKADESPPPGLPEQ